MSDNGSVLTDITERRQEENRIRRYNRILEGVNLIFSKVVQAKTEEELGNACLSVALELTGSQIGFVGEVGSDGLLHDISVSDIKWNQCTLYDKTGHRRPPGDFILRGLGHVIDSRKSFFTNDPLELPYSLGVPLGHPSLTSFLGVSLIEEGKVVGMIAVANREGGYSYEQQEDLEAIAPVVTQSLKRKREEQERKRVEQKLRGREERYKAFFNTHAVGTVEIDLKGRLTKVNDRYCQITGYSREELLKMNVMELSHPDDSNNDHNLLVDYLNHETPTFDVEKRYVLKDGRVIWVQVTAAIVCDSEGSPLRSIEMIQDITERKKTEETLRESESRIKVAEAVEVERRRLIGVLETLPVMICLLTPDYCVAFANRGFRERFGESGGRHCYEYCFGFTKPCDFCQAYQVLETGQSHHWEINAPDGSVIDTYDFPFTDVDGSPMILEMDIDVTEQKR
jgi:PAS domain S-box-containing protein